MILIDTDICIGIIRGIKHINEKATGYPSDIIISFMTYGELIYGAYHSNQAQRNLKKVELFISGVKIVHSNEAIMQKFGALKSRLRKEGNALPDADLMIASTALVECGHLATGNTKHFNRLGEYGLQVENWMHE